MLLILVCHDGHNVHNVQPFVEVGLESVLGKAHGQELGPHLIFIDRTLLNSSMRAWVGRLPLLSPTVVAANTHVVLVIHV